MQGIGLMIFDMFDCDSDGQTVEIFHVGLRPHIVIRAYARCPFLRSWDHEKDAHEMAKCISDFYTMIDIEDLRTIAPMYANFAKYPLLMTQIEHWPIVQLSDNIFPNQYEESTISILTEECSVKNVLDMNCKVLSRLVHMPNLDCSYPSASNTTSSTSMTLEKAEHFTADCHHINLTREEQ